MDFGRKFEALVVVDNPNEAEGTAGGTEEASDETLGIASFNECTPEWISIIELGFMDC